MKEEEIGPFKYIVMVSHFCTLRTVHGEWNCFKIIKFSKVKSSEKKVTNLGKLKTEIISKRSNFLWSSKVGSSQAGTLNITGTRWWDRMSFVYNISVYLGICLILVGSCQLTTWHVYFSCATFPQGSVEIVFPTIKISNCGF